MSFFSFSRSISLCQCLSIIPLHSLSLPPLSTPFLSLETSKEVLALENPQAAWLDPSHLLLLNNRGGGGGGGLIGGEGGRALCLTLETNGGSVSSLSIESLGVSVPPSCVHSPAFPPSLSLSSCASFSSAVRPPLSVIDLRWIETH